MSAIPFATVVSYMSIRVESSCLFNCAFCSISNHHFVFFLKHSLRARKISELKSMPTSKFFHCFNNDGTGKCMGMLTLKIYDKQMRHTNPTIFFQLEWFIWASSTSCRCTKDMPWMLQEMLFSGAHSVSIISPSTCLALWM